MKKKSLILVLLAAPLAFGVVACNKSDSTAAQVEQQLAEAKAQAEKAEKELAALREQEAAAKAEEAQKQLEAAQAEAEAARKEAEEAKARAAAAEKASKKKQAAAAAAATPVVSKPEPKPVCQDCGTVAGVTAVQVQGEGSGMGAVAGAIAGAVIGHQFGRGQGNTAAKVVGAAGGGYAGNEIEKRMRSTTVYDVTVQMDNGSTRTVRVADPSGISSGERVRVEGSNLVRI